MFEIEVKKKTIGGQVHDQKIYVCQHCGVILDTVHGYRINCSSCFKWNPTVADLLNNGLYRVKFHLSRERKTPL